MAPLWRRALEEALPDPAVRDFLQVLAGMTITGLVRDDVFVVLLGEGETAKSTILDALVAALGDYAHPIQVKTLLRQQGGARDFTQLRGVRLAAASELSRRYEVDAPTLKLISGGSPLPDGHGGHFHNSATLWMETNQMPKLGDTSYAMRRRLLVIPFQHKPARKDVTIKQRLKSPAAGMAVLKWMLAGAQRYYAEGLVIPEAVEKAGNRALLLDDPVDSFYLALMDSDTPTPFTVLYRQLDTLCREAKVKTPGIAKVSRALRDRFHVDDSSHRDVLVYAVSTL